MKKYNEKFLLQVVVVLCFFLLGCAQEPAPTSSTEEEAKITPPSLQPVPSLILDFHVLTKNKVLFYSHLENLLIVKRGLKKGRGTLNCLLLKDFRKINSKVGSYFDESDYCEGVLLAGFIYNNKKEVAFYFLAGEHKNGRFSIREYQVQADGSMIFLGEQFFDIPKENISLKIRTMGEDGFV